MVHRADALGPAAALAGNPGVDRTKMDPRRSNVLERLPAVGRSAILVAAGSPHWREEVVARSRGEVTMRRGCLKPLAGLSLVLCGTTFCLANDSSAELSVGGLVFTRSADVSMESEELRITPEIITVRYRFLNQTPNPVALTVAFPLPDIDLSEAENYAFPTSDPVNFVGFETKIDGKPVNFTVHQQAFLGDKDISATLRRLDVPLLPIGAGQARLAELPQQTRDKLINEGLLVQSGSDDKGQPLFDATWTVKTSMVRQQTFPPNKPVLVEHRYKTSLGVGFDTILRRGLRQNKAMENEVERYRMQYCITPDFYASVDKLAGSAEGNVANVQERRISYVLKTGANWAGPIKDFRVAIDKGKPDRLVSFCGENVKKISPTVFEMTAKDFTPDKDLRILLIGRF
jgi:hypothetical protein